MTDANHILVVDDDQRIRDMLCLYLEDEGFNVATAADGDEMRQHMAENPVDLILLDLVMPGTDGLTLSREIRAESDIPIIILTGKGEPIDRVVGLEVGADDYITKPFHLREVLARVRTVLRRAAPQPAASPQAPSAPSQSNSDGGDERLQFAGWRLDLVKRELLDPSGAQTPLTTGEFNLLSAFAQRPNRPLDRDQIMDVVKGQDWQPFDRSIDTQIGRLRKKLEADPKDPQLIKTVRGVGYIFTPKVESLE
ncbi:MAG: response regulator [Alphaproteobacteria bacterium]|nr:response regulator [Alphaproteobacteria bacterium]